MPSPTQRLGAQGEAEAEAFLIANGYHILDQHVTSRFGELDLVARQGKTLIFIEVRRRRSGRFGSPEESLTERKLEHLAAAIELYRNAHPDLATLPYRLDLIVIDEATQPRLRHLTNLSAELADR